MINVALASADRKFARELRLQLIGWGYRPWMADPEESLLDQIQDRGADLLILDFTAPLGNPPGTVRSIKSGSWKTRRRRPQQPRLKAQRAKGKTAPQRLRRPRLRCSG